MFVGVSVYWFWGWFLVFFFGVFGCCGMVLVCFVLYGCVVFFVGLFFGVWCLGVMLVVGFCCLVCLCLSLFFGSGFGGAFLSVVFLWCCWVVGVGVWVYCAIVCWLFCGCVVFFCVCGLCFCYFWRFFFCFSCVFVVLVVCGLLLIVGVVVVLLVFLFLGWVVVFWGGGLLSLSSCFGFCVFLCFFLLLCVFFVFGCVCLFCSLGVVVSGFLGIFLSWVSVVFCFLCVLFVLLCGFWFSVGVLCLLLVGSFLCFGLVCVTAFVLSLLVFICFWFGVFLSSAGFAGLVWL